MGLYLFGICFFEMGIHALPKPSFATFICVLHTFMTTFIQKIKAATQSNQSLLCVGLDPDPNRFPEHLQGKENNIYDFCVAIVDATLDLVNSYKPQIAYFSAHRAEEQLEKIIAYIRQQAPHLPIILDAKRGDIGATAEQYAIEAFERYGADAVTLSPFMGFDTVKPYLQRHDKGAFLLCRTSNRGGDDIQNQALMLEGTPKVYEHIAQQAQNNWNINGQLGLVVGATYPNEIMRVRELAPDLPLLIPGIGAQGGDITATVQAAWKEHEDGSFTPVIINSSRAIIYAGQNERFADAARVQALVTRDALNAARPAPRQPDALT